MGQYRMTPLLLAVWLASGVALGLGYFRCLATSARLFAAGGHAGQALLLMLGRFGAAACVLFVASRHGAFPLLMVALGVTIARFWAIRAARISIA
jgi:hypothetical protein